MRRRLNAEGGPARNRLHETQALQLEATLLSIRGGGVNEAVMDRLLDLHWRGYPISRAEIEAALGLDSPRGQWVCCGEFDARGKLIQHCRKGAA